jgi:uracil-DNA glycosylase family 4
MGEGDIGDAIKLALKGANLNMNDVYITALVKCGKEKDEEITNEHIKTFLPFLQKEIELTSPPVIICLGTKASRTLNPDLKGSYEEIIGLSTYSKEFDATLIYGFNPAMLFHRPHLQGELDKIMLKVADVVM